MFAGHENKHGGWRRSKQLVEFFTNEKFSHVDYFDLKKIDLRIQDYIIFFAILLSNIGYLRYLKFKSYMKSCFLAAKIFREAHNFELVSFEYGPNEFMFGILFWSNFPIKKREYICCPHNIEGHVRDQPFSWLRNDNIFFDSELKVLRRASRVLFISKYDQDVVKLSEKKSQVFYYFPPTSVLDGLLEIRELRKNKSKENWIYLGSYSNPPSKLSLLETLKVFKAEAYDGDLSIMGFGTEKVAEEIVLPENIKLLGGVSDKQLSDNIIKTQGLFIHMNETSGLLTRMVEFAIMEVPIIWFGRYRQRFELETGNISIDRIAYETEKKRIVKFLGGIRI